MTNIWTVFMVLGVAVLAPHLDETTAKGIAIVCCMLGIVFWAIDIATRRN